MYGRHWVIQHLGPYSLNICLVQIWVNANPNLVPCCLTNSLYNLFRNLRTSLKYDKMKVSADGHSLLEDLYEYDLYFKFQKTLPLKQTQLQVQKRILSSFLHQMTRLVTCLLLSTVCLLLLHNSLLFILRNSGSSWGRDLGIFSCKKWNSPLKSSRDGTIFSCKYWKGLWKW